MKIFIIIILFLPSNMISASILIEKAALFANSVFKEFITSIVWRHDDPDDDVTEFIKEFRGCIVLTPVEEGNNATIQEFNSNHSYTQTVFIANKLQDLKYFIEVLSNDLVSTVRLIAVLTKPATFTEMTELMEVSWNNDVADILLVSSNKEDVLLTTYFPYNNGKCGDSTPVYLTHDTKILFPRKFRNFQGCQIRATLLQMSPYSRLNFENDTLKSLSGIHGNVLNILFTILNASMNVVSAVDHGGIGTAINGSATGSFADIVNKKADILCPALIMTLLRWPYVQYSQSLETLNVYWFGPKRREISEWLRVLRPLMSHVAPAFFTSSIVFIVVTTVIRRFGPHRSFSEDSIIFQSFIIFLGQEAKFETKSWLTNSLFMLWIWFCMVVRIVYQGDLVHGLQNTILESPFQTFETAVEEVDGYGGAEVFKEFLKGTSYYNGYEVIMLRNVTDYLVDIEAGKSFLLLTDKLIGLDSAPSIQLLSDDLVSQGPVCFHMRPGWPAVPEINDFLLGMIEAGLMQKVFRDYFWEVAKNSGSNDRNAQPLTLGTLIGCFYGLGVLYIVCILVFFIEIAHNKIKQNRMKPTS